MRPIGYDANLQADEGVRVPWRPIAPKLDGRSMRKQAVDAVQGGAGVDSPLPPATWSRGSREGENGIRSRPNGVHN